MTNRRVNQMNLLHRISDFNSKSGDYGMNSQEKKANPPHCHHNLPLAMNSKKKEIKRRHTKLLMSSHLIGWENQLHHPSHVTHPPQQAMGPIGYRLWMPWRSVLGTRTYIYTHSALQFLFSPLTILKEKQQRRCKKTSTKAIHTLETQTNAAVQAKSIRNCKGIHRSGSTSTHLH